MNKNYLLLYGYGWSGSGAVLDFFKENSNIQISDNYFFLLRDRGGLIDLQNNLVNNWDMFRSSVAINDFLKLCERSKKPMLSLFSLPGRDYKKQFGIEFDYAIREFINEITEFRYYSYEHSLNMSKNYVECAISRLIHQLDKRNCKIPLNSKEYFYFSKPTQESFTLASRSLINRLYIDKCNKRYLLIDHHPLPVHNSNLMFDFFGAGTKMIVVDRDPRDIYIDLVNNRMRIGSEMYRTHDVDKYIIWHKKSREFSENENILRVRFEDLVLKYEEMSKTILDFLGLDESTHSDPLKYFDPSISEKNIGMWEHCSDPVMLKSCQTIKERLPEYCYN